MLFMPQKGISPFGKVKKDTFCDIHCPNFNVKHDATKFDLQKLQLAKHLLAFVYGRSEIQRNGHAIATHGNGRVAIIYESMAECLESYVIRPHQTGFSFGL